MTVRRIIFYLIGLVILAVALATLFGWAVTRPMLDVCEPSTARIGGVVLAFLCVGFVAYLQNKNKEEPIHIAPR